MHKRTSLKDIANRLGVSIALVSYVMTGQEKERRVNAEMARKIRLVAEELNYQPNQIARSLRMSSTKSIGMIVADIANPFFANLCRIVENEADNHGYTVFFGSSDEDSGKSGLLINTFLNRQVDGFIIAPADGSQAQIQRLVKKKIPTVLIDRYFPEVKASYVCINNFQGTYEATQYLLGQGHENISMFAYDSDLIHMKERIRGYEEAMKDGGMLNQISLFSIRHNHSPEDMDRAFDILIRQNKPEQALLFATSPLSIEGLYCIKKSHLKIPDDISFLGFDGGESFDLFDPPLSFVKQPMEEMGVKSFSILMDLIKGSGKVSHIILNPSLVIRNSD